MTFTRRWFGLFLAGALPLALIGISPGFLGLTLLWDGALLVATLADLLLLPSPDSLGVERLVERQLSLGAANRVELVIRNRSELAWNLTVHDEPPDGIPHDFEDTSLAVEAKSRARLAYHATPTARGDFHFGDLWMRVAGRLDLVNRQWRLPAAQSVKVYPNLAETAKFSLLAKRGRLLHAGIRAARLIGAGREFESLREYQPDDDYRRIDWKATARRDELITRQYEVERSQNIILVLDVGRTMLAEIDGIAKIDYALNAALLLAYVAAQSDDRVGLLVFADRVQTWIPPQKGRAQVYRILEVLYHVNASLAEPDYKGAFTYLAAKWRRRSLVVSFTDLWDPDSSKQAMTQLAGLQPRHLVACATLMDTKVLRASERMPSAPSDVYEQAAAIQVLEDRARATAELKRRGVLVIDSPADRFSAALVNRYLEVKEKMLL